MTLTLGHYLVAGRHAVRVGGHWYLLEPQKLDRAC
jgi:hypothetical protein